MSWRSWGIRGHFSSPGEGGISRLLSKKKNLLTPKLKALVQNSILTKFVAIFIALYLEKQMEHFCSGNRVSPDFSWESFSSNLFNHTNNTYYSNNRKRCCFGKLVNFKSWEELLSARLHPGLVEVVNAWLKSPRWYLRCLKGYYEPGVAQQRCGVCEVVSLQMCVLQTLVKHLHLFGCRVLTEQSGACSWSFVWQQLCFYCSGQVLGCWRLRCCGKSWAPAVSKVAQGQSWLCKWLSWYQSIYEIWKILYQLPWTSFLRAFIMFSHRHV